MAAFGGESGNEMATQTAGQSLSAAQGIIAVVIGNWPRVYDFIVFSFFAGDDQRAAELIGVVQCAAGGFGDVLGRVSDAAHRRRHYRRVCGPRGAQGRADAHHHADGGGDGVVALTPGTTRSDCSAHTSCDRALDPGASCGGEVGPATSYLRIAAHRGALTSWQGTSQQFAGIAGTGLGLALAASLTEEQLYDWGWRIPFLIGVLIGPVGLYIRRVLPETMDKHEMHETSAAVLSELFAKHWWTIVLAVLCIVGPTISTYVFGYRRPAIRTLQLSTEVGMMTTLSGYVASAIGIPIGAWASDKFGVKVSVLVPRVFFLLVVFQGFVLMTAPGASVETLLAVNMVLNFLMALSYGGLYVLLTEGFPKAVRSSGLSIAYAVSVTVFGGSTQLVIAYLIETFENPLVPAYYQIAANILSVVSPLITIRDEKRPAVEAEAPG
jgi:MHS family proline/betaine transporter-like MFS transporter